MPVEETPADGGGGVCLGSTETDATKGLVLGNRLKAEILIMKIVEVGVGKMRRPATAWSLDSMMAMIWLGLMGWERAEATRQGYKDAEDCRAGADANRQSEHGDESEGGIFGSELTEVRSGHRRLLSEPTPAALFASAGPASTLFEAAEFEEGLMMSCRRACRTGRCSGVVSDAGGRETSAVEIGLDLASGKDKFK